MCSGAMPTPVSWTLKEAPSCPSSQASVTRPPAAGKRRCIGRETLEERRHTHALRGRWWRRLQHREREQVLDDAVHARSLLAHHADVVAHALRVELELAHRF